MEKIKPIPYTDTDIHRFCLEKNLQKVEDLLANGIDPDICYEIPHMLINDETIDQANKTDVFLEGLAPYHIAMITKNMDLVHLLAEYNAYPYIICETRIYGMELPSEFAAEKGFIDALRFFNERGYGLYQGGSLPCFRPALSAISPNSNTDTLDYILESAGLTAATLNIHQYSNLLRKAENADAPPAFVEHLVSHGLDLNKEPSFPESDFQAWDDGYLVNPWRLQAWNLSNKYHRAGYLNTLYDTLPLIRAARNGNVNYVNHYLRLGALPTLRDQYGNTALDAASDSRAAPLMPQHRAVHSILLEAIKETKTPIPFPRPKPDLATLS